jgi:hypothetical protein
MMTPNKFLEEASRLNLNVNKAVKLLMGIRKYVAKNINNGFSIILEAWEIA